MVKILSVCYDHNIHTHSLVLHMACMGLKTDTDNCSGVEKEPLVLDSSLWLQVSCQLL